MEETWRLQDEKDPTVKKRGKRKRKERVKEKDMDRRRKEVIEETIKKWKEKHPKLKRISDRTLEIIKGEIKESRNMEVTLEELRAVNVWLRQRRNNYDYREREREKEMERTGGERAKPGRKIGNNDNSGRIRGRKGERR